MAALAIWVVASIAPVAGIETPKYELVSKHEGYEVRQYQPQIAAEVTVQGEFNNALNEGFRKLANFIFGNNTKVSDAETNASEKIEMTAPVIEREVASEKIAMTAPVIEQEAAPGSRIVSFIMPSKYTLETLPKPNNPDVRIVEIPGKRYAVNRFSGRVTASKAANKKRELSDALKRDNIETVGEPMLAQYNPPWTLPPMRRNEVMVELK